MIEFSVAPRRRASLLIPNARSCARNPAFNFPQPQTIRLVANDVVGGPQDLYRLLSQSSLQANYSAPALINRRSRPIKHGISVIDPCEKGPEEHLGAIQREPGTIPDNTLGYCIPCIPMLPLPSKSPRQNESSSLPAFISSFRISRFSSKR